MLVECNYCGAPLDVREGSRFTKCGYCGTVDERAKLRTVAAATPRDFRPPPRWVPPAHVPADSAQELKFKKSGGSWVVAIVLIAVLAVPLVLIGGVIAKASGVGAPGGAELGRVKLEQGPKELGSDLSGSSTPTTVYAGIDSARYEYVTFNWDDKHLEHPTSFYFAAKKDTAFDEKIRRALSQKLHSELDQNGSWRWEYINLNVDLKTGSISGSSTVEIGTGQPNPLWKRQLDALWQIVVGAIYGLELGPTEAEAQELLGTGYAFKSLAKFDPSTPIESARARLGQMFPGVPFTASGNLTGEVAVDHPLFRYVELEWHNEKGATMRDAGFRPRPNGYEGRQAAVASCLAKTFGKAQANDTDYMAGKKDFRFELKDLNIYVSSSYLYVIGPMDSAFWTKFIGALDGCGR